MSRNLLKSIGYSVRVERFRANCSQKELCKKTGLDLAYIDAVEKGEKNLTIANCALIAYALNISLSDLIIKSELAFDYTQNRI